MTDSTHDKPATKNLSFPIPEDTYDRLNQQAKARGLTKASLARLILIEGLKRLAPPQPVVLFDQDAPTPGQ